MTRGMIYKAMFIVAILVFAVLLILPTVGKREMSVVLEKDATAEQVADLEKRFTGGGMLVVRTDGVVSVSGYGINDAVMNEVKIISGVKDVRILPHWSEKALLAKKMNLGLDLQGGMNLVMRADFESIEHKQGKKLTDSEKRDITQQALELLRNRIDKFGVSEPSIRPRGVEAIEIQLPGVKDPMSVKKAIGTTGRVEYRLVDDEYTRLAGLWLKNNVHRLKEGKIPEDVEQQYTILEEAAKAIGLSPKSELLFFYERDEKTKKILPAYPIALEKKVALAGDDISRAWVGHDEFGRLSVHFTTTPDGASKFATVTSAKNHGRKLAIVIDEKVRSAPQVNVQITTGQALIQGDFTLEEVNTLTRIIKEGALPVNLVIIEERTVGPSLGQDAIDAGIKATIMAFSVVMIFMVAYYKLSGFIASVGLILNMICQLALLSWLGFTLTLPGIAGFILTLGMAVDSNVLIYERIREEQRSGKSPRIAVVNGFERAFWAIVDSNITTLIAAFVLSQFGTGPIKGFAVTLSIGLISSLFVVLYVTRFVFELLSLSKNLKKLSV
ncbi:MAG TPA: protein translocase subunit SecD [Spirochaetota bacterium]|nr:protein translocase subunit SecD [Spirochaetota bacterium]